MEVIAFTKRSTWAAALVAVALSVAPATARAAWKGGGGGHGGAVQRSAPNQGHWSGGDNRCAGCHQGGGWRGGDGDHDRDDRGFREGHHDGGSHGGVFVGVGPGWWGPPDYAWWYGPPAYAVPAPPPADDSQMYVEQPPTPAGESGGYWYYCPDSEAYYPTVTSCAEPWVKVRPRAP